MFKDVPSQFNFPRMEEEILAFWEKERIYERSLERRTGGKPFIFFEGPPTANGLPHPGHCLTRAIKDLFPRFRTMTGHYCLRKGGWDTHGLPVEVEVCKELGIHTKEEIEAYGVEKFNRKCLESVFRYTREWEDLTRRLGFWVNLDEAYVTYHQSYVESVWWSLKQLFDAGLLYQGYKIVWWWAQGGTALSAGEVGQGYREVDDPSVYVRFPLVMDERAKKFLAECGVRTADRNEPRISLLVWTTTPWTLPSNMFAAVHGDFDYAVVHDEETGERLIFAAALVEQIAKKAKKAKRWKIAHTVNGADLIGLRYVPPFDCYYKAEHNFGAGYEGPAKTWGQLCLPTSSEVRTQKKGESPVQDRISQSKESPSVQFVFWRVLHAPFVTLQSGTGLVHQAPAFGEVDFELFCEERQRFIQPKQGLPLFCPVFPNGHFSDVGPEYCRRRWVKDCDRDIIRDLKEREAYPGSGIPILLHQETYRHDYPFCWRAEEDPLIQYPRKSWFIRTTAFRDAMLENNRHINWMPEHIREGRFGNFLRENKDWALSRERYWGTPLPIWVCDVCGHTEAVESYDALLSKSGVGGLEVWEAAKNKEPSLSDHLKVHRPYIDAITYACPKCAAGESEAARSEVHGSLAPARMRRVPEVIDCWYDSGAMPFAQWGFPHLPGSIERFREQFPADFISEALDQTRGWFYSLVAISTLLFGNDGVARDLAPNAAGATPAPRGHGQSNLDYPLPFRNCIVLGLLMGEDGLKMSKQKKNYKEPSYIFEHEGADAMRWLFFSGQAPWTSIRFQESAIAEGQREFLIRLYNCYSFFVIYANIDKWTPNGAPDEARPSHHAVPLSELDRWILSELAHCSVTVFDRLNEYDNFAAARALVEFVDGLSNWYIRRSRDRFWKAGLDTDKRAAYATLYECLVTVAKLIAPFTPFLAESMYQNLVRSVNSAAPASVHLCDYPVTGATRNAVVTRVDRNLREEVRLVRQVVSCGRAARSAAKLRVRQPLLAMELFHRQCETIRRHEEAIKDELNVKCIEYVSSAQIDRYVQYELKPDFRKIGPRLGPLAPKVKAALAACADVDALVGALEARGACSIEVDGRSVELAGDEVLVELQAREGYAAQRIPGCGVLVLDTHLTPELIDEGLARDLVNQIQQVRKTLNLRYEQRINLAVVGDADIQRFLGGFSAYVMRETLAECLLTTPIRGAAPTRAEIEGRPVEIYVQPL